MPPFGDFCFRRKRRMRILWWLLYAPASDLGREGTAGKKKYGKNHRLVTDRRRKARNQGVCAKRISDFGQNACRVFRYSAFGLCHRNLLCCKSFFPQSKTRRLPQRGWRGGIRIDESDRRTIQKYRQNRCGGCFRHILHRCRPKLPHNVCGLCGDAQKRGRERAQTC